ncbi:MAG: CDP-alcohol phosphatidyltransferase family protein [Acidimicrobiia bacterium]
MSGSRVLTIPNLVSFARLATVPVFWWVLLGKEQVTLAALLLIAVGWTDWIDGYLARRLNQVTRLGAILDPVADRLTIASAVVAGLIAGIIPSPIGIPLLVREVIMAVVTLFVAARGAPVLEVRYLGKLATFLLYGAIPFFYLATAGHLEGLLAPLAWLTGVTGLVLYWVVLVQYLGDARVALANVESPPNPQES